MAIGFFDNMSRLFHGSVRNRVEALATIVMCFAAGALASSLLLALADPFVNGDISHSSIAPAIGGAVCAVIAGVKVS